MTQHSQNGEGELLPCPLCGGDADLIQSPWEGQARIACEGCNLSTDNGQEAATVAHWNTRQSLPREPATAASTPPDELARLQLLADVELHLQSVRIFLTKREKMHPCGVDLHDELQARVTAAITEGKQNG